MNAHDSSVRDIIASVPPASTRFSIEIYPPRTEKSKQNLPAMLQSYIEAGITHVNVTGKVGINFDTLELVRFIKQHVPECVPVPHIIGYGLARSECDKLIEEYTALGVRNVFVVRGDIPEGGAVTRHNQNSFAYASHLIAHIKQIAPYMCVGAAGYPAGHYEQPNFLQDMRNLQNKVRAGADYIVTQMFFSNNEFDDFVQRCRLFGITVPVVPGITWIKSRTHAEKLATLALGSVISACLLCDLQRAKNETQAVEAGHAWLENQVRRFTHIGEPLVHFYVFNVHEPFQSIIQKYNALASAS